MKIAFFDFVTHLGGAQRSITEFAITLNRLGHSVTFIDAYGAIEEHETWVRQSEIPYLVLYRGARYVTIGYEGSPIHRLLRAMKALPELVIVAKRLRKFLKENDFDVVLVTQYKALRILLYAIKGINTRVIYWCRGSSVPSAAIKRKVQKRVDRFLCLSNSIRKISIDKGLPERKVCVVSNAIDIEKLNAQAKTPLLTEKLPGQDKPVRILIPATLIPCKGQDCAIRALKCMVQEGIDAVLYLAGDSATNNSKFKRNLIELATILGVKDRVYFLGWRKDIPQIIKRSTIVMLASHTEGVPRCIMEAMALKTPVVATSVGGIPELLGYSAGGTLVEINDHIGICKSIRKGLDGEFSEKVDIAYILAGKKLNRKRQANKFVKIVEDIF